MSITSRVLGRVLLTAMLLAGLFALRIPSVEAAVTPTTTLSLSPASPNGVPPWYLTSPEAFVQSDQDATVYYWWSDAVVRQKTVTAGAPVSIGFAPDGTEVLSAYSVSAAGTETPGVTRVVYTDTQVPGRPPLLEGSVVGGASVLQWEGSADSGPSGISGYWIYRSDNAALFEIADRIGFTTSTTFSDTDALGGELLWYAVAARDNAGNESLLTDSVRPARASRVAGADRYSTALAISSAAFADGTASTVIIASGLDYPDALCASGLAGAVGAPILLVGRGPVSQGVLDEIDRLGATDAFVIGGTAAVAADTFASVESALSGTVRRLWGATRFETAAAVTQELLSQGETPARAYLVSGQDYPDALSVAAAAFAEASPVLFATPQDVPTTTRAALASSGATSTLIAGGPVALWAGAEAVVPLATRVAGADRFATSRAFADWALAEGVLAEPFLAVATGRAFPDGLAAGPFAGSNGGPVVLTYGSDASALRTWLSADPTRFTSAVVLGGPAALGPEIDAAIAASLAIE